MGSDQFACHSFFIPVLLTMHNGALILACLACALRARRLQIQVGQSDLGPCARNEKRLPAANATSQSLAKPRSPWRVSPTVSATVPRDAWKAVSMLLVAFTPAAALKACYSGVTARRRELSRPTSLAAPHPYIPSLRADAMEPLSEQRPAPPLARPVDPLAKMEAAARKKKVNDFKLNVGEAIDSLNTDIPQILRVEPNWDIYTEDLELDLDAVDPIAYRLIGGVLGLLTRKVKGLRINKRALRRLHKFCRYYVKSDEVRIKIWLSPGSLVTFPDGKEGVIVRWNARLKMKRDMELIPTWASTSIRFVQRSLPGIFGSFNPEQERLIVVDSVSRFYINAEGRINKHVIDSMDLLPPLTMPAVDEMLYMVGLGGHLPQPAAAYMEPGV